LGAQLLQQADGTADLKELATEIYPETKVLSLPPGRQSTQQFDPQHTTRYTELASDRFKIFWHD